MLETSDNKKRLIFYEDSFGEKMRELSSESLIGFIKTFIQSDIESPTILPPYQLEIFSETSKATIAMVCQVFIYNYDLVVDDIVLGFLLMSNLISHDSPVKLVIIFFLVEMIHDQLKNFASLDFFRYKSYILILIVYYNKEFVNKYDLKMTLA